MDKAGGTGTVTVNETRDGEGERYEEDEEGCNHVIFLNESMANASGLPP
jgi:hypothetical protein